MNNIRKCLILMLIISISIMPSMADVSTKYIGVNNVLVGELDIELNFSNTQEGFYMVNESYYKVNNFNESTLLGSRVIYSGYPMNGEVVHTLRLGDSYSKIYSVIEQTVTVDGQVIQHFRYDLRPIWYTYIIDTGLGYSIYLGHCETKNMDLFG